MSEHFSLQEPKLFLTSYSRLQMSPYLDLRHFSPLSPASPAASLLPLWCLPPPVLISSNVPRLAFPFPPGLFVFGPFAKEKPKPPMSFERFQSSRRLLFEPPGDTIRRWIKALVPVSKRVWTGPLCMQDVQRMKKLAIVVTIVFVIVFLYLNLLWVLNKEKSRHIASK